MKNRFMNLVAKVLVFILLLMVFPVPDVIPPLCSAVTTTTGDIDEISDTETSEGDIEANPPVDISIDKTEKPPVNTATQSLDKEVYASIALYRKGMELIESGEYDKAWTSLSRAHELDDGNTAYMRWLMYVSVYLGQTAIFGNDHDTALRYFTAALDMKKRLTTDQDFEYVAIQRYIDLTREHAQYRNTTPEYIHTFQVLYIRNTDLKDTVDKAGKTVVSKGTMTDRQIQATFRSHALLKFYIETLTKGRVSLSFERKTVETTLTRAVIYAGNAKRTIFRPDFESTTESLGPYLFEGRNRFDTTLYYFRNENFTVWPFANGIANTYVPYTWNGPARGSIAMPMSDDTKIKNATRLSKFTNSWVLFHEFFHVIERMSGVIGPQHAHLDSAFPKARANFPDWVPDPNRSWTAREYSWYRYHLQNTVPEQMEKQAALRGIYPPFRNFGFVPKSPDRTDDQVFAAYTRALRGTTAENLREAGLFYSKGKGLISKKPAEAVEFLKQALQHNPYHHRVLYELGSAAIRDKNPDEADRYFERLASVFPDANLLFTIAKTFFNKGDYPRAAKYFRAAAEPREGNQVYTWWLGKALLAAGDTVAAKPVLERIEKNPLMTCPIAIIICTDAKQALYSMANPGDESTASLGAPHRQEGYLWKLLPSGDPGYVLIVSDYNWKCLEAYGDRGNYVIKLSDNERTDGQLWRIETGDDGRSRIVSKKSGLPLAITVPAKGKKAYLTLKPNVTGRQYWDIQILDSAFNRWNSEQTVGIVSVLTGTALDLSSGGMNDGALISLWARQRANANQHWRLLPSDEADHVYIVSEKSWKCLTATRDGERIGTVQMGVTGKTNQKWRVVPKEGERYALVNKEFDKALEVDPTKTPLLHLSDRDDSAGQIWKLER